MLSIGQGTDLAVEALHQAAQAYVGALLGQLRGKRLRVVGVLMVLGILAGQAPVTTHMAGGVREGSRYISEMARRRYRFVWNSRLSYTTLQSGL